MIDKSLLDLVESIKIDFTEELAIMEGEPISYNSPNDLTHALSSAIYKIHHCQTKHSSMAREATRKSDFSKEFKSQWWPVELNKDGFCILDGVSVNVEGELLRHTKSGTEVFLPRERPSLIPGFIFTGSNPYKVNSSASTLRIYRSSGSPEEAAHYWKNLLVYSKKWGFDWNAKACTAFDTYPRSDSIVVYLGKHSIPHWEEVVSTLEGEDRATSIFCRQVGPGVSLSFDPVDYRARFSKVSFGQHRSQTVAKAVIDYVEAPEGDVIEILARYCVEAGIDPENPWRNLSSPWVPRLVAN